SSPADALPHPYPPPFPYTTLFRSVVANGGANTLWLYLGKGDGTSQLPTIIPLLGQAPVAVVAADLRGIGISDLIVAEADSGTIGDRKSTRLNSSHQIISYAVFCLK